MSLISPLWLLAGLLAVPVILLYLLKMKRREVEISSTMLWSRALADMRASSPFQKLRRNLLLFLQLLILALLVLALAGPALNSGSENQLDTVVIIDASASMAARDIDGDISRFDAALDLADELVESLASDQRMMIVVAGPPGGGLRSQFTDNSYQLHQLLDAARKQGCYECPAAVAQAVQLAISSLDSGSGEDISGEIVLISDGAGARLPADRRLSGLIRQVLVGASSDNVAIVSLGVETTEADRRVVVGVQNFSDSPRKVLVNFYHQQVDNWIDSRELTLDSGQRGSVVLQRDLAAGRLWAKLDSGGDALSADDTAFAILPKASALTVQLVSDYNPVLSRFLAAAADSNRVTPQVVSPDKWTADLKADFTIFDLCAPAGSELLEGDVLYISPPQTAGVFEPVGMLDQPGVINSRSEDMVLRHVDLNTLEIAKAVRYSHDDKAVELISAGGGPLLGYTQTGPARKYVLAFHLADSTWATDPGLLILLSNMFDRTSRAHFIGRGQMVSTGQPAEITPSFGGRAITVIAPGGRSYKISGDSRSYGFVDKAGFYTVQDGKTDSIFAANLLSEAESDITPSRLNLPLAAGDQQVEAAVVESSQILWPLLAAIALVVLLAEWWIFHRRILV